jgi:hypothetical protein
VGSEQHRRLFYLRIYLRVFGEQAPVIHKITFFSFASLDIFTVIRYAVLKKQAAFGVTGIVCWDRCCFSFRVSHVFYFGGKYPAEHAAYLVRQLYAGIPAYRVVEADEALSEHPERAA